MSDIDTGGPAFPSTNNVRVGDCVTGGHEGLTIRDYFAAKALQALIDGFLRDGLRDKLHEFATERNLEAEEYLSEAAYVHADAMLKERMK